MIKRLVLGSGHADELKRFATDSLPFESCALLAGNTDGTDVIVRKVIFAENVEKSETRFSIEPNELLKVYKEAEDAGLEIVGIFHSHPAPARPSSTDAKYMEINPIPWLIMSTTENNIMAFIYDKTIQNLELVIQ